MLYESDFCVLEAGPLRSRATATLCKHGFNTVCALRRVHTAIRLVHKTTIAAAFRVQCHVCRLLMLTV